MERIASFTVDHKKINRGIYLSRIDEINVNYITTFDVRIKLPNREPVINIAELHTMEHLGATFLRNHPTWNLCNFKREIRIKRHSWLNEGTLKIYGRI